ncbi:hypothetical protein BZA70DRAFT_252600 [Myxozyma melibiosi]|uniref:Uncharacterized protein n=1 Tax=Myxozyma melibiosi TaxID=54550 RepID=A0ABR1FAZ0_9ASCO
MFYDADDPETQRMRELIAADYSDDNDEQDDYIDSDLVDDDVLDDEDGGGGSGRVQRDDDGEEMDVDQAVDESVYDPMLLDDSARATSSRAATRGGGAHSSSGRLGKKKKKKKCVPGAAREHEPSGEVKILLGQANQAYAADQLDEAERILAEVIRIDNHVYPAWKTLGEIHKQRGDIPKCLLAWISAGHLRLKDSELWSICGKLSFQIGQVDQALYCYNRAILGNSQDIEAIFERGLVFKEMGSYGRALEAFKKLHDMLPDDLTIIRELASVYVLQKNISAAALLYEQVLHKVRTPPSGSSRPLPPPPPPVLGDDDLQDSRSQQLRFGWSELNILAELYGAQNEWLKAIKFVKSTARWLLLRADETFWDDVPDDNDDEYDADLAQHHRYFPPLKINDAEALRAYTLPLDLRAKLAIYRLKLGNLETALKHVKFVLAEAEKEPEIGMDGRPSLRFADLFLDVADALAEAEKYEQALALYAPLGEIDEYAAPQLIMSMGKCLHGLEDFDQAEAAYRTVIEGDSANLDARIALAEVYEATGKRREALELVNEVMRIRKESERERSSVQVSDHTQQQQQQPTRDNNDGEDGSTEQKRDVVPSFIPNTEGGRAGRPGRRPKPNSKPKSTRSEKMAAEESAAVVVQSKVKRLRQYRDGLATGNPVAIAEWLQAASELVDMFTNVKAFFSGDKHKVFKGFFVTTKKRAGKQTITDKLKGMVSRLQESLQDERVIDEEEDEDEDDKVEQATEFRDLPFDEWFDIFMQYALMLTWHEEVEDAYAVLRRAKEANVFLQDKRKMRVLNLVHLSCSLHVGDYRTAGDTIRTMIASQEKLFDPNMYRLFLCCAPGGRDALEAFNSTGFQKYMLRQVKGLDSVLQGKVISGSINVTHGQVSECSEDRQGPILFNLYGQLLASSRSYVPSLGYYMRAYAITPQEPMVLFSIGLSHLHRAMQRQSSNRHLHIVQGLSYLIDYHRTRPLTTAQRAHLAWAEQQEVNYNLGRAFQMLGLPSLAIKYYERVLQIAPPLVSDEGRENSAFDLRIDAAYNLQLLYTLSGNAKYAKMIVDEYLVI